LVCRLARSGLGLWLPALVLVLSGRPARAEGPQVSVRVEPCVPVDRGQLERLLAIELGTSAAENAVASTPTHVWVSCSALGIELHVEDGVTRKSMARVLPASSFTDASSTRLLALAIAEFVVASWIELRVQPRHAVEPVGPPPTPAAQQLAERVVASRSAGTEPDAEPSDSLSAAFTMQLWSAHDGLLLGGGVRLLRLALPQLAWTIGGDLSSAAVDVPFGTVHVLTASVSLAAALHLRVESVSFYTGPGGRMGFTRMRGEPTDRVQDKADHFFAPYGGPIWWNRIEFCATERLRLAFELELGIATLPAKALAGSTQVLALDGVWLTTALSIGFGF
jgi:hypothetical protein